MYKLLIIIISSISLFAAFPGYKPTTTITNYDVNITIAPSGQLDITEIIEVAPRKLWKDMAVDNPLLILEISSMLQSKSAIRSIDNEPYDFSVFLNNIPVYWGENIIKKNSPNQSIILRLQTDYMMNVLTESEEKHLENIQNQYIYTLKYKLKKTVTEDANSNFESIRWNILKNQSHIYVKKCSVNIFFPPKMGEKEIKNLDWTYTALNQKKQLYVWKNNHHFYAQIDNLRNNDLVFKVTFPEGLLQQSAKDNFDLVLNSKSEKKDTFSFIRDTFFLYYPIPFLILYFIFLYYYARSYGSFAAMGSIVVRYEPPNNMSLLQSAILIDKSADNVDLAAAIVELASLGYLKIIDKGWGKEVVLKQIRKDTKPLTEDQIYLLKRVLFPGRDIFYYSKHKTRLYQQLDILNEKLHTWFLKEGYISNNVKKIKKIFLIKALLTSVPILIFSLYVTKDLYGENLMIWAIVGIYFMTGIIAVVLLKYGIVNALPFLLAIYIIIGLPFVLTTNSYWILLSNPMMILPFIYGLIWFFYKRIGIYTYKGLQAYRYLHGYKEFVIRTEVPKLQFVMKEHSDYINTSLAYALLFKAIKYPILAVYQRNLDTNKILDDYNNNYKTVYLGGIRVKSNITMEYFIFWITGIILFLILKAIKL